MRALKLGALNAESGMIGCAVNLLLQTKKAAIKIRDITRSARIYGVCHPKAGAWLGVGMISDCS